MTLAIGARGPVSADGRPLWGNVAAGAAPTEDWRAPFGLGMDLNFQRAADAGVNLPDLFEQLKVRGASQEQINSFGQMLANPDADFAGQFGKFSQQDTREKNLDAFLKQGGNEKFDAQTLAADTGSGGWLQHHGGDVLNWASNPIDAATGNRMSGELGRLGGRMYDETFGNIGGWLGDKVFGEHGMAAPYTRHLMNMTAGGVMPGADSGYRADYANARQRGMDPAQANRALGQNAATSATALVGGGLLSGLGAGGVAGTGLSTGSALGNSAVNAGLMGAARSGAGSAIEGGDLEDIMRSAGVGALSGAVSAGAGGAVNAGAGGGMLGTVLGRTAGGLAGGATRTALQGGGGDDILESALMGGATSGVGAAVGGGTLGSLAGNLTGAGLNQLFNDGGGSVPTGQAVMRPPLDGNVAAGAANGTTAAGDPNKLMTMPGANHMTRGDEALNPGVQDPGVPPVNGPPAGHGLDPLGIHDAETAASLADPWGPNRYYYQNRLNNLMQDPSSVENLPGYQFRLAQGNEQINRNMAATGGVGSGQQLAELMQFGQGLASQEFASEEARLERLAGVQSSSPSSAAMSWAMGRQNLQGNLGGLASLLGQGLFGQGGLGGFLGSLFGQNGLVGQAGSGIMGVLRSLFGGGAGGGGPGAGGMPSNPDSNPNMDPWNQFNDTTPFGAGNTPYWEGGQDTWLDEGGNYVNPYTPDFSNEGFDPNTYPSFVDPSYGDPGVEIDWGDYDPSFWDEGG